MITIQNGRKRGFHITLNLPDTKISESIQIAILALRRTKYFIYRTQETFEYFMKIHFSYSSNKVMHIMSTQRKKSHTYLDYRHQTSLELQNTPPLTVRIQILSQGIGMLTYCSKFTKLPTDRQVY